MALLFRSRGFEVPGQAQSRRSVSDFSLDRLSRVRLEARGGADLRLRVRGVILVLLLHAARCGGPHPEPNICSQSVKLSQSCLSDASPRPRESETFWPLRSDQTIFRYIFKVSAQ